MFLSPWIIRRDIVHMHFVYKLILIVFIFGWPVCIDDFQTYFLLFQMYQHPSIETALTCRRKSNKTAFQHICLTLVNTKKKCLHGRHTITHFLISILFHQHTRIYYVYKMLNRLHLISLKYIWIYFSIFNLQPSSLLVFLYISY